MEFSATIEMEVSKELIEKLTKDYEHTKLYYEMQIYEVFDLFFEGFLGIDKLRCKK